MEEVKEVMTFLEAAAKVLEEFGNEESMHYRRVTDIALENNWIVTDGKTPEATMSARLTTTIKKAQNREEECMFTRPSKGHYGLSKWDDASWLSSEIRKHNKETRKAILDRVMEMSPKEFEGLVGQLLAEMNFEEVEQTNYVNDKGVDVRGTMVIDGVIRIKLAVQVKRWGKNIQRQTVQQLRGSLGAHDHGLIITTSNFSSGARKEAEEGNKIPIDLMDGEQLAVLLMKYHEGIAL